MHVFKTLDCRGRVTLPFSVREAADLKPGDIIRVGVQDGKISAEKVNLLATGDQSQEAVEEYVFSAVRTMDNNTLLALAARLIALVEGSRRSIGSE